MGVADVSENHVVEFGLETPAVFGHHLAVARDGDGVVRAQLHEAVAADHGIHQLRQGVAKFPEFFAIAGRGGEPGIIGQGRGRDEAIVPAIDVGVLFLEQNSGAGGLWNLRESLAQQVERRLIEILQHARLGRDPPVFHRVKGKAVLSKEYDARQKFRGAGQQAQLGFGHYAQSPFGADKQVDPIHAWAQAIAAGMLGGLWNRNRRNREIHGVAPFHIEHAAIHEDHAQPQHVPPRVSVAEASRAAGVGGDSAADRGGRLGRVRRIELSRAGGCGVKAGQQDSCAGDGASLAYFQTIEFFQRK